MATTAQDLVCPVSALNDGLDTSSQDIEEGRDIYRPGGFHPDLWNLGAVVLEMFRAIRMFSEEYP